MQPSQIAVNLYSLKGFVETPAEIQSALRRVRGMGYEAVQVSGLGKIDDVELAQMIANEGLICCATHEPAEPLLAEPERSAERLERLGCRYTAYPYPAGIDLASEAAVAQWISQLNSAGKTLHDAGKVMCYHNHQMEFRRLGGKIILERIFDETDPRYVQAELDTYWVQYGGGDPIAWARKMRGRQPLIHLKDYMIDGANQPQYTDVGAGTLDFPIIIAEAEAGGCEWFIVERDPAPSDPFESIARSFEYLAGIASGAV